MTRRKTAIVLQARLGSLRLPGKVLAPIGRMSILGHCLVRLQARHIAPVIVATTTSAEDQAVVEEAKRYGASAVRGPVDDVLARFTLAADVHGLDDLVRATADNPAVDMDAPARVLEALRDRESDHVIDRGLPHGTAVEAMRVDALRQTARWATSPADREHVTPYLRRHASLYRILEIDAPEAVRRPELRLTVDTPGDLAYMRRVFALLPASDAPVPLADIIRAAEAVGRPAEAA